MRQITPGESVALGQEGTGNAVILNQPDFSSANYRLAALHLDEGRRKEERDNKAMEDIQPYLQTPEDYFMPDTKEIYDLHEQQVKYVADAIRRGVDVKDPRNYEDYSKFTKMNSDFNKKAYASSLAKQTFAEAQKAFNPMKHDAEHFRDRTKKFLEAKGIDERAKMPTDFLIEKFNPMEMFSILPGKKIPEDAAKARLGLGQVLTTPEGIQMYVRGTQGSNPAWTNPKEMEDWWMKTWESVRDVPKSTGNTTATTSKTDKPGVTLNYNLDYQKAGSAVPGDAYDVADIVGASDFYVNSWYDGTPKTKEAQQKNEINQSSTAFMPRGVERDPKTGEIYFWGKKVPESKASENLNEGDFKDISVPYKGNETFFKNAFKGTPLENPDQYLNEQRDSVMPSALEGYHKKQVDATSGYVVTPSPDPVDIAHQEFVFKQVPGVTDAKVVNDKVTLYANGQAITLSMDKDSTVIKDVISGNKSVTALFLNPKYGNTVVLRNNNGSEITEVK